MSIRVRFRINKVTGEVEEFLVDDLDQTLPEAEHDRIAADIGRVLVRQPRLTEVDPRAAQTSGPGRSADQEDSRQADSAETGPLRQR